MVVVGREKAVALLLAREELADATRVESPSLVVVVGGGEGNSSVAGRSGINVSAPRFVAVPLGFSCSWRAAREVSRREK